MTNSNINIAKTDFLKNNGSIKTTNEFTSLSSSSNNNINTAELKTTLNSNFTISSSNSKCENNLILKDKIKVEKVLSNNQRKIITNSNNNNSTSNSILNIRNSTKHIKSISEIPKSNKSYSNNNLCKSQSRIKPLEQMTINKVADNNCNNSNKEKLIEITKDFIPDVIYNTNVTISSKVNTVSSSLKSDKIRKTEKALDKFNQKNKNKSIDDIKSSYNNTSYNSIGNNYNNYNTEISLSNGDKNSANVNKNMHKISYANFKEQTMDSSFGFDKIKNNNYTRNINRDNFVTNIDNSNNTSAINFKRSNNSKTIFNSRLNIKHKTSFSNHKSDNYSFVERNSSSCNNILNDNSSKSTNLKSSVIRNISRAANNNSQINIKNKSNNYSLDLLKHFRKDK